MNVNHALSLNVSSSSVPPTLHMTQGDSNSRSIVAALFSGASPFNIPSGSSVMVRFGKPDGTGGLYDTTESGSPVVFSGNTVTAPVAEQMLSVPGVVVAQIELYSAATEESPAYRLASFCFFVDVEKSAYPDDTIISSDYYNILSESIQQALQYSQISQSSAKDAEAWAIGQRGGVDVPSTDPAYNNSAKYWAQNAGTINLETSRVTGTLPLSKGGTGATTAAAARTKLGLGTLATKSAARLDGSDVTGTLPVSKGGTGAKTQADALANLKALPLAGGAMDAGSKITHPGNSSAWAGGRDLAILRRPDVVSDSSLYYPIISSKTVAGDWTIGTLDNGLFINYTSDTDYSNRTGNTHQFLLNSDGNIYYPGGAAAVTSGTLGASGSATVSGSFDSRIFKNLLVIIRSESKNGGNYYTTFTLPSMAGEWGLFLPTYNDYYRVVVTITGSDGNMAVTLRMESSVSGTPAWIYATA